MPRFVLVFLSRWVELTAQWDRILAVGPLYPVTLEDLNVIRGVGLGEFYRAVSDVHRRLSDFIHAIVVHRRDEAIRGWRNWVRRIHGASLQVASSRFGSPSSISPV